MIKSDQILPFFKKSGPAITVLTNYGFFGESDVKRLKKNAPARQLRQQSPDWGVKNKKKTRPCEECTTTEPILGKQIQ